MKTVSKSHKIKLRGIKCVGFLDFSKSGAIKIYKTKAAMLAARLLRKTKDLLPKNVFNLALMRKWLLEAKILLLRAKRYTWELSCKIASLKCELKAMKFGYHTMIKEFIYLPFSKRKNLFFF